MLLLFSRSAVFDSLRPMDCSMPGFSVFHYLLEFVQTHLHWVNDAIQTSHSLLPPSPSALDLSQHQSFPMSWLFSSGGQSIGASASASVLPMNTQGWFPLGLTDLITCCPRDSQESSPAPQFESIMFQLTEQISRFQKFITENDSNINRQKYITVSEINFQRGQLV